VKNVLFLAAYCLP